MSANVATAVKLLGKLVLLGLKLGLKVKLNLDYYLDKLGWLPKRYSI